MYFQQDKQRTTASLLLVLCLLGFLLTACNVPWAQASKQQPLQPLKVDPGWKVVFQTHGDTTNQSDIKSQSISLGQVPANGSLGLSIACTGQGAANAQIEIPSLASTSTACTDTPHTTGIISAIESYNASHTQLSVNITISGSVKWEAMVEETA